MELLGALSPSSGHSASLSAAPAPPDLPCPGGDDASRLGDAAGLAHCWKPEKRSRGEEAELTKTPLWSSERTPRSHMSTSKSSFSFESTSTSISKSPANSSNYLRRDGYGSTFGFSFFSKKEAEVVKFSLRGTEFLERSIIPLSKVNTVGRLSLLFPIGQDSAILFPPPPPNNGSAHSARLSGGCQNFQVARQVQRFAGVCGGTNEKAAQTPSTNHSVPILEPF